MREASPVVTGNKYRNPSQIFFSERPGNTQSPKGISSSNPSLDSSENPTGEEAERLQKPEGMEDTRSTTPIKST